MTDNGWKFRVEQARIAMERTARRVGGSLRAPAITIGHALSRRPTRLVIAPQDLRTADPTVANDLYAGHFAFAGRIVSAGGHSPFDIEPPTRGWAIGLYGFGWLRHLRASDSATARALARALVEDFVRAPSLHPVARETAVAARRLIAMVSHSPLLLEGADLAFYRRFVGLVQSHVVRVKQAIARETAPLARLQGAIALCYAALAFDRSDGLLHRAATMLEREAGEQILADGGHTSRNPRVTVDLLLDLLPLRQSFAARQQEQPVAIGEMVGRMLRHLRFLRHSEGSLPLFHGAGPVPRDWLATLSIYDDARGEAALVAPQSGYHRLVDGPSVLLFDGGPPPPPTFAGNAHASALAFEFSSGACRIIVNCGAPAEDRSALADAARSTAAHSTVTFADTSSATFTRLPGDVLVVSGPTSVLTDRPEEAEGRTVHAVHDGYLASYSVLHRRSLTLRDDGLALDGQDWFEGRPSAERTDATLRFHLMPGTQTTLFAGKQAVLLVLPDGQAWRFEAGGLEIDLDESIYFAGGNTPRRAEQMVVTINVAEQPNVAWSLVRAREAAERARGGEEATPADGETT